MSKTIEDLKHAVWEAHLEVLKQESALEELLKDRRTKQTYRDAEDMALVRVQQQAVERAKSSYHKAVKALEDAKAASRAAF